ncbi:Alpha/Beta hydrolase protein [Gymnopilus junonius]|uniref:Alpha/Beta hydrolase protein n=1 Tax=Gymnopilus junonius TaxID=109634 RepID=A0A9P5TJX4_GYMJU|nr:Alpha/Beta hydrolase protein [Gymnopilus junonius]
MKKIEFLRKKLALTRLPDELEDAGRDYERLLARWKDGYDWRIHEKKLNEELPQFQKEIDVDGHGRLNIHFIHRRSEVEGAIPLLFVHGWPGSFVEVRKILPLLIQGGKDHPAFHVVTFSLTRVWFLRGSETKGICNRSIRGGYEQYAMTQGGDWGYPITARIASTYGGRHAKAWHTNVEYARPGQDPPKLFSNPLLYFRNLVKGYTEAEKAGLQRTIWFREKGRGYSAEQSTQPQTLGYSLADSPAGLLAWIYEKLVNWTDEYPWEDDEVLTWISIYWFSTAGPTASTRIYYERVNEKARAAVPTIPHGASFFPKELYNVPRLWSKTRYRVFEAEHATGGHLAAHEKPEELVPDLRKMFGRGGQAYGVIEGKTGY